MPTRPEVAATPFEKSRICRGLKRPEESRRRRVGSNRGPEMPSEGVLETPGKVKVTPRNPWAPQNVEPAN